MGRIHLNTLKTGVTFISEAFEKAANSKNFVKNVTLHQDTTFKIASRAIGDTVEIARPRARQFNIDESVLRQQIEEGLSIPKIAKEHGCSSGTIKDIMNSLGLKTKEAQRAANITKEELERILASGGDCKDIARRYQITEMQAGKVLRKHGLETDVDKIVKMITKQDILDMQEAGMPNSMLHKIFGIPDYTMAKILRDYGLSDNQCYLTRLANESVEVSKEALETLFLAGKTKKEMAEELGISINRVTKYLDDFGICEKRNIVRASSVLPDNYTLNRLINKEGLSLEEIADDYDITVNALKNHLKKAGISKNTDEIVGFEKVKQLAEEGYSVRDISKITGMPLNYVRREVDVQDLKITITKERFVTGYKEWLEQSYSAKPKYRSPETYFGLNKREWEYMHNLYFDDILEIKRNFYKAHNMK